MASQTENSILRGLAGDENPPSLDYDGAPRLLDQSPPESNENKLRRHFA